MKTIENKDLSKKIVEGLEKAYEKMIIFKRSINSPVVISRDGKIVKVSPFDMPSTTKYK